jgi:hypothetical protein
LLYKIEETKREDGKSALEILAIKRKAQLEKLEGNELVKVEHLLQLGFDETVMKEHLVAINRQLRQNMKRKQMDVSNLGSNVQKMMITNQESEKAVSAAYGAYGPLVVRQQSLQSKLEKADMELYAIQAKVDHRRNMESVEIASKDKFKSTMKDIVRKLQIRCRDQELLQDVLRNAGKSFQTDLSLSPAERATGKRGKEADQNVSSSPMNLFLSGDGITMRETTKKESESVSVSSSGTSSVEISSLET